MIIDEKTNEKNQNFLEIFDERTYFINLESYMSMYLYKQITIYIYIYIAASEDRPPLRAPKVGRKP